MEWQPIETAPPDEWVEVIVAGRFDNGVSYVQVSCRTYAGHWHGLRLSPPTHWMPLPPPPAE